MRVHLFGGCPGAYALSLRETEPRLPAARGPWRRWKEFETSGDDTDRIRIDADQRAALHRDGYVVLRSLVIEDA